MGLPCLNCQCDVPQSKGKLFAECFLCPDCFTIAERIYKQSQCELQQLLVTLKELLRLSIVKHQLSLPPPTSDAGDGQLHQKRSLELIMEMMKNRESSECTTPPKSTRSSEKASTKLSAATPGVAGLLSSSSTSEQNSSQETPSTETPPTEPPDNA